MQENKLALFEEKEIRRTWYNEDWYFSIIDVVEVLAETDRPRKYWSDLKKKLILEGFIEVSEKIGQLKMLAKDGKRRLTDVADTKILLRIVKQFLLQKRNLLNYG